EESGSVAKGGSNEAKVRLEPPQSGNKGRVLISLNGKEVSFDVAENLGRDVEIRGTPYTLKIENYWPDFRIQDGKPNSVTDRPNNPAVLVTIRGRGVPATETASNPHGAGAEFNATGGRPQQICRTVCAFASNKTAKSSSNGCRRAGRSPCQLRLTRP